MGKVVTGLQSNPVTTHEIINSYGKMTFSDGTIYEGEYKDGRLNGQGKLATPSGNVYEGEFKDGKMHGQGKMAFSDGSVYEGEWGDDDLNGYGKMTLSDGTNIEGEWKDGYMHGHGKQTLSSGSVYEGEFKDGERHGQGKMTLPDGSVCEGEWKDDDLNGYGKIAFSDGTIYEGEYKDGRLNGQGKLAMPSGNVYEGEFKDGKMHGQGKMAFSDGSVYEGEWKDGYMHGHGKKTLSDGTILEGEWKDNKLEVVETKDQEDLICKDDSAKEEPEHQDRLDSGQSRVKKRGELFSVLVLILLLICATFTVFINADRVKLEGFRLSEESGDGYGDSDGGDGVREIYTSEYIDSGALGDAVVFNAISDGKVGDERNFVGARPKGLLKSKKWSTDTIKVKDGEIYTVCVYVHNDNPKSEDAVAENVKVTIAVPTNVWKAQTVVGYIDSDNASPNRCWDTVTFISDDLFYLEYLEETARYTNATMGTVELNNGTITLGALLGDDKLDGKIPGGYDHAGIVTMDVKVHKSVEASLQVDARMKGDGEWTESVDAEIGDEVEFRISYENLQEATVDDVMIRDILPSNMEYVEGSTFLYNKENEDGARIKETISTEGVNIGSYGPKENAVIVFTGRVIDNDLAKGSNQLVNWASATVRLTEVYKDDVSVMVEK